MTRPWICPSCGAKVPIAFDSCFECGQSANPEPEPETMTEQATARPCWTALMDYTQADTDGIMVTVSRQAIHECEDDHKTLQAHAKAMAEALKNLMRPVRPLHELSMGEREQVVAHQVDCKEKALLALTAFTEWKKNNAE